jgi:hypothetical protein
MKAGVFQASGPMQLTARSLIRKVIGVMRWDGFSNGQRRLRGRLVTPQQMGGAVRRCFSLRSVGHALADRNTQITQGA